MLQKKKTEEEIAREERREKRRKEKEERRKEKEERKKQKEKEEEEKGGIFVQATFKITFVSPFLTLKNCPYPKNSIQISLIRFFFIFVFG